MSGWHQRPFGVFDLETTGVDTNEAGIVSGYVGLVTPTGPARGVRDVWSHLVNPGRPSHPEAVKVHGITDERAIAEGVPSGLAVEQLVTALLRVAFPQDPEVPYRPIVVMNGAFDFTILDRRARAHGVPSLSDVQGVVGTFPPIIDAYVLDKQRDPFRKGKRNLAALCAHYRVPLDGAHEARADAVAAGRVAWRQAQHWGLGEIDPMVLHQEQVGWRRAQSERLQAHFRKTRPNAVVDPCWPVCLPESCPNGGRSE